MSIVNYVPDKTKIKNNKTEQGGYYIAKCDVCGTEYYPKSKRSKYCSARCSASVYNSRRKKKKVTSQKSSVVDEGAIMREYYAKVKQYKDSIELLDNINNYSYMLDKLSDENRKTLQRLIETIYTNVVNKEKEDNKTSVSKNPTVKRKLASDKIKIK